MTLPHAIHFLFVIDSYQNLGATLTRLNVPLVVSEVHGLCCGLLCSLPSASAKTRWFTETLDAASLSADQVALKAAEIKALDEWFGQTLSVLNGNDLDFNPLVPDDNVPVNDRITALKDFCAGFTYGIGIALSQRGHTPLPADSQEIIEDFQAIEAADSIHDNEAAKPVASHDQNSEEEVYNELLEYVRVGVLLVLEELRPVTAVSQEKLS